MSVINRSPVNTASGAGFRYWQDEDFTRLEARLMSGGVDTRTAATALEVTEKAAGADMSVDVKAGYCLVEITRSARTFKVWVEVTALENLPISSNASGSTRYDLVCVKVDSTLDPDTQADNMCSLIIVEGTGGAGVPATPANHLKLAEVEVINGAATIPDAKITDSRVALPDLDEVPTNTTKTLANERPPSKYFPITFNFEALAALASVNGASSTVATLPEAIEFRTDASTGSYANVKADFWVVGPSYSHDSEMFLPIRLASTVNQDVFVGLADFTEAAVVPVNAASNIKHIGFFIADGALYTSNADGATQTINNQGSAALTVAGTLRIVINAGVSIEFYKNEVLIDTHTTSLPSGNTQSFFGITATANQLKIMEIGNTLWYRDKTYGGA